MIPYLMETATDCGPRTMRSMTGLPWERITGAWPGGWRGGSGDTGPLGVPNDTPWDHLGALESLGIAYRVVTCGQILAGEARPEKTAILLHFDMPEGSARGWLAWFWRLLWPVLRQHWVILREVTPTTVSVWYGGAGPDQSRTWTHAEFARLYSAGWPACAYEIGRGTGRLTAWQRLVARVTGRFA